MEHSLCHFESFALFFTGYIVPKSRGRDFACTVLEASLGSSVRVVSSVTRLFTEFAVHSSANFDRIPLCERAGDPWPRLYIHIRVRDAYL